MLKVLINRAIKVAFLRRIVVPVWRVLAGKKALVFSNSAQYWNDRYKAGLTSGAGSFGRLAEFKAEFLNNFVTEYAVDSVIEFGCGDGAQLALANYPYYVGFDVSPIAVEACRKKFLDAPNYEFHEMFVYHDKEGQFDLALSLDVIYHLIEDDVFDRYMKRLFKASDRYVIIFSYNFEKIYRGQHERGREFLKWCEANAYDWKLVETVENIYPYDENDPNNTSQSDFFVFKKEDV